MYISSNNNDQYIKKQFGTNFSLLSNQYADSDVVLSSFRTLTARSFKHTQAFTTSDQTLVSLLEANTTFTTVFVTRKKTFNA